MDLLPWIATLARLLTPVAIFLIILKTWRESAETSNNAESSEMEDLSTPEGVYPTLDQPEYSEFGDSKPSNLTSNEKEKLKNKCREILEDFKQEKIIEKVDSKLLDAIIESKTSTEKEEIVLDYLEKQNYLFRYSHEPVLKPVSDYSNYFTRIIDMCKDDFPHIDFDPSSGVKINSDEELSFSTFLTFPRYDYGERDYSNRNFYPRKQGTAPIELDGVVSQINKLLEKYDREKRFFYDKSENHLFDKGTVWYGKSEQIEFIVNRLNIEAKLFTDRNQENPLIQNEI